MSAIQRESSYLTVTIDSGDAESEVFEFYPYGGGMLCVPSGWTDANIGFKISHLEGGTFTPLKDETGTIVEISTITTNASYWYNFPIELFGAKWVKLWSKNTASEADVAQGGDREIVVTPKA